MLAFCQHWSVWIGSHKTSAWLYKTFIFWRGEETVTSVDFYKGRGGGEWIRYLRHLVSLNVYPIGWVVLFYLCSVLVMSARMKLSLYIVFCAVLNCFSQLARSAESPSHERKLMPMPFWTHNDSALFETWNWKGLVALFTHVIIHQPRSQDPLSSSEKGPWERRWIHLMELLNPV